MEHILLYNGRFWRQGGSLYDWIKFTPKTGLVTEVGIGDPDSSNVSHSYDMKQQWIFPGFHDSHLHVGATGKLMNKKYNLQLPKSIGELRKNLATIAALRSNSENWLVGYNWDHHMMERLPTLEDLDAVVSDVPVVVFRVCMHICVVNSKALSKLNISKSSSAANSYIGKFGKDHPKFGEPNGILCEDKGMRMIFEQLPELTSEQKMENILVALKQCLKQGITSVHTCEDEHWNEYVSLAKCGKLPFDCYYSPYCSNIDSSNFPSKPGEAYENLSCDIVKVFIDGALGAQTAALSVPYLKKNPDGSENFGLLQKTKEEFENVFKWINEAGYRFEIHVIGDKAAEVALDLLESTNVSPSSRPIFVHCQILRDDLITRMLKCGVVPTIQPSFVPTDSAWIDGNLPSALKSCVYPWKTLLQKGFNCGGSSDSPVETTDPLQGIYDAIFRQSPNGTTFVESECLSFSEAIDLYTVGSAFADDVETYKGKLEVGFHASLVVLDVPPLSDGSPANLPENPRLLKSTTVKEVWVKGKQAWSKQSN